MFVPVVPLFEEYKVATLELESGDSDKKPESTAYVRSFGRSYLIRLATLPEKNVTRESALLSTGDMNLFLSEQLRSAREAFEEFDKMFPDDGKLITHNEANIVAILQHGLKIAQYFADGVDYLEDMLRKQLGTQP